MLGILHQETGFTLNALSDRYLRVSVTLVFERLTAVRDYQELTKSPNKKNTRQLGIQRLPGMNAAKIGIYFELCKYLC